MFNENRSFLLQYNDYLRRHCIADALILAKDHLKKMQIHADRATLGVDLLNAVKIADTASLLYQESEEKLKKLSMLFERMLEDQMLNGSAVREQKARFVSDDHLLQILNSWLENISRIKKDARHIP